jgi:hypothetical protein
MSIDTERNLPEAWNAATVLMMAVGCVVLIYIAWHTFQTAAFLHHATRVTGVVVDPAGHPTIRFSTADGVPVEFVQNGFISRPRGAAVPVAYDMHNPAVTARAAGFTLLPLFGVRARFRPGRY